MNDTERQQVLKMVEEGRITAEEGLKLMQALGDGAAEASDAVETVETGQGGEAEGGTISQPDFDRALARFRLLWLVPLSAGVLLTVFSAWWMYAALQSSGLGLWFYCALAPFLLGVASVAIGFESRAARWVYVDIEQKPGESPRRIVIPFPLSPVSWLMSLLGPFIPFEQRGAVDKLMQVVFKGTTSTEPLFVDVRDDDGQRVRVYIG